MAFQRPAFVSTNQIAAQAIFSRLINGDVLSITLDTMLADSQGYQSHAERFGPMPTP